MKIENIQQNPDLVIDLIEQLSAGSSPEKLKDFIMQINYHLDLYYSECAKYYDYKNFEERELFANSANPCGNIVYSFFSLIKDIESFHSSSVDELSKIKEKCIRFYDIFCKFCIIDQEKRTQSTLIVFEQFRHFSRKGIKLEELFKTENEATIYTAHAFIVAAIEIKKSEYIEKFTSLIYVFCNEIPFKNLLEINPENKNLLDEYKNSLQEIETKLLEAHRSI